MKFVDFVVVILLVMLSLVGVMALAWWIVPERVLPPDTCAAQGGTRVRTNSGTICARVEVIKP